MDTLNQSVKGYNNIQAGRDIFLNPVINVINVTYSDIKTFEKVLKSIPPANFIEEVLMPFMEIHKELKPEKIVTDDLKLLLNQCNYEKKFPD